MGLLKILHALLPAGVHQTDKATLFVIGRIDAWTNGSEKSSSSSGGTAVDDLGRGSCPYDAL